MRRLRRARPKRRLPRVAEETTAPAVEEPVPAHTRPVFRRRRRPPLPTKPHPVRPRRAQPVSQATSRPRFPTMGSRRPQRQRSPRWQRQPTTTPVCGSGSRRRCDTSAVGRGGADAIPVDRSAAPVRFAWKTDAAGRFNAIVRRVRDGGRRARSRIARPQLQGGGAKPRPRCPGRNRRAAGAARHLVRPLGIVAGRRHRPQDPGRSGRPARL